MAMRPRTEKWGFLLLLAGLFLAALACNAPFSETDQAPSPPAATPTPAGLPTSTATEPAVAATTGPGEQTPLPTFTRIQPTLAATVTPRATDTPRLTATVRATVTPTEDADLDEPLSFSYTIRWRLNPTNPQMAIAAVVISAQGGGGGYVYFRDDLPVDGPVFEYPWAACTANPGSLRVDSANGQSVRVDYFEQAPCPTATPTS